MSATNERDEKIQPGGPSIAHEIPKVRVVADSASDSERLLELVDRIIVLENKLAEATHRHRLQTMPVEYSGAPAAQPPAERLPYQGARDVYSKLLTMPAIGAAARRSVRLAKKARAARS